MQPTSKPAFASTSVGGLLFRLKSMAPPSQRAHFRRWRCSQVFVALLYGLLVATLFLPLLVAARVLSLLSRGLTYLTGYIYGNHRKSLLSSIQYGIFSSHSYTPAAPAHCTQSTCHIEAAAPADPTAEASG